MPRLTETEKQDIIRHLEAGKPLPEKYRFLVFDDKREVELVWNGKTNEVCNVVLPFQTIEHVDEPRSEDDTARARSRAEGKEHQQLLFSVDERGRQLKGWTNKLIWGDNKLILSSLKNGPLREEIERQGGIKLIYIDPPFDVGADFSMDIEIGDDTFTKKPNAASIKEKGSKIVVERGQIVKISKDAKGIVTRDVLTKDWTDWIDYWSVDFDFENKKEIIRVKDEATGEFVEQWTGDFIFENEWQSFRTKKDRSLELTSAAREVAKDKKRVKIAVKVVDIFGNDTMTIVDVAVKK